jgi:heptosyltransferase-1
MDSKSVREFPAHLSYFTRFNVPKNLHAVTRQNKLLANTLKYGENINISNYGISKNNFLDPKLNLPTKFAVLVQNASWPSKQWSISKWQQLINHLDQLNIYTFLPSGNETELERAKEIASCSDKAIALELMSLNEIAFLIDKADFSVCSDTGLAHLSAVVGTPSITLYGPTDVNLIGTYGDNQEHIITKNKDLNNIKVDEVISKLPKI